MGLKKFIIFYIIELLRAVNTLEYGTNQHQNTHLKAKTCTGKQSF
jgi:hypothetical protein